MVNTRQKHVFMVVRWAYDNINIICIHCEHQEIPNPFGTKDVMSMLKVLHAIANTSDVYCEDYINRNPQRVRIFTEEKLTELIALPQSFLIDLNGDTNSN